MKRTMALALIAATFFGAMAGSWLYHYRKDLISQQTAQAIVGAPPQVLQMDPGKDVIPER